MYIYICLYIYIDRQEKCINLHIQVQTKKNILRNHLHLLIQVSLQPPLDGFGIVSKGHGGEAADDVEHGESEVNH